MRRMTPILASLAILLAACGTASDGGDGDSSQSTSVEVCTGPGPMTGQVLPKFDPAITETHANPCLTIFNLDSRILDLIPDIELTRVDKFVKGVTTFVNRVKVVSDAASCGYETDRLAIEFYQDIDPQWSVGAVAVIRGDLDEILIEGTPCFLMSQIEDWLPASLVADDSEGGVVAEGPEETFCFDVRRETRSGETFTILWLGSSVGICSRLLSFYDGSDGSPTTSSTNPVPANVTFVSKTSFDGMPWEEFPILLSQGDTQGLRTAPHGKCWDVENGRSVRLVDNATLRGSEVIYSVLVSLVEGKNCNVANQLDENSKLITIPADRGAKETSITVSGGGQMHTLYLAITSDR